MRVRLAVTLIGLGLVVSVKPIQAHHSIAAQYDLSKTITIKGTITKVEWMNPHAHVFLSVTGADGRVVDWDVEMVSPNVLMKNGWTKDLFKRGDQISVDALEAKDGTKLGYARAVTWPDGHILTVPRDLFASIPN